MRVQPLSANAMKNPSPDRGDMDGEAFCDLIDGETIIIKDFKHRRISQNLYVVDSATIAVVRDRLNDFAKDRIC